MKKVGLVLITLLLTVVFVNAQPGNFDPAARLKRQLDQLTQTCSLTKDQVPKVETILKKYSDQRSKMFQDMQNGGDRSAMRDKMTKMQDDQSKEIKAILTADQAKKYDAYLKEQQERRQQRMNGGGGPGM